MEDERTIDRCQTGSITQKPLSSLQQACLIVSESKSKISTRKFTQHLSPNICMPIIVNVPVFSFRQQSLTRFFGETSVQWDISCGADILYFSTAVLNIPYIVDSTFCWRNSRSKQTLYYTFLQEWSIWTLKHVFFLTMLWLIELYHREKKRLQDERIV